VFIGPGRVELPQLFVASEQIWTGDRQVVHLDAQFVRLEKLLLHAQRRQRRPATERDVAPHRPQRRHLGWRFAADQPQ
jgi:hypothetical protein